MAHAEATRTIAPRQHHPAILHSTSTSTMKAMKAEVLNRLECAVEKLKDARKEIHEAGRNLLVALKMKEDGDDIADCVMAAMVALANEN